MQWSDGPSAGFTRGTPWLPIPPTYKKYNVRSELRDPDSILEFYRHLLALRHRDRALLEGDYVPLNEDNASVLSYLRRYQNEAVLVALNMSGSIEAVNFDWTQLGFSRARVKVLLTTLHTLPSARLDKVSLEPYSVYIARLSK